MVTDHRAAPVPPLVLLIVDQPVLAEVISLALNHGRFTTRVAPDVLQAITLLAVWRPHLIVVDMDVGDDAMLKHLGGTAAPENRVPVIGLTRRGDLKTKLAAFDQGVDDFLTVPFSPEELVARALVIMRRTYGIHPVLKPALQLGDLEIDVLKRSVRVGDHELHLTSIEQNLLYLLAANAGRILTRDEILDYMWGVDYIAESNVVDRHVRALRSKLQDSWRRPRYIATVPGKGYRFVSTVDPSPRHDDPS